MSAAPPPAPHPAPDPSRPRGTAPGRTMRAVVSRTYGPPEVLEPTHLPWPAAGRGEVVIRVLAVAVSRAEAHMRAADPPIARLASGLLRPRDPVPGSDLAGEVVEVGPDVDGLVPGDRVVAVSMRGGGFAEALALRADAVVPLPDGMTPADAVAITEGGLTALPFVRDHGRVGRGTRLLVNGASGAVGVMAVQLGAHLGAEVTGVCSTANLDLVRSLGARHVIDRTREDFTATGAAYDVVLDAAGTSSFRRARHALAPRGRYLTTVPSVAIGPQMLWTRLRPGRRATLATTGLRPLPAKTADMAWLLSLAAEGGIRAVVHRTFPLEDAVEAHRLVDTGKKRGSVLVTPAARETATRWRDTPPRTA